MATKRTKIPHLGHKFLKSKEIYINIEHRLLNASDDTFAVNLAEKPEEIKTPLEIGCDYVCQKDNLIFLRKRK